MALTPSYMVPIGTEMPSFLLPDVTNNDSKVDSRFLKNENPILVMFICAHCPYVVHIEPQLASLSSDYKGRVNVVAISSNDVVSHPQDSPEKLKVQSEKNNFNFPYCFDEDQSVAKAFNAQCTPDFFLFDSQKKLVYRGQLDNSRPGNDFPADGKDLRKAIDLLLNKQEISENQLPSMGCNIKWRE